MNVNNRHNSPAFGVVKIHIPPKTNPEVIEHITDIMKTNVEPIWAVHKEHGYDVHVGARPYEEKFSNGLSASLNKHFDNHGIKVEIK